MATNYSYDLQRKGNKAVTIYVTIQNENENVTIRNQWKPSFVSYEYSDEYLHQRYANELPKTINSFREYLNTLIDLSNAGVGEQKTEFVVKLMYSTYYYIMRYKNMHNLNFIKAVTKKIREACEMEQYHLYFNVLAKYLRNLEQIK